MDIIIPIFSWASVVERLSQGFINLDHKRFHGADYRFQLHGLNPRFSEDVSPQPGSRDFSKESGKAVLAREVVALKGSIPIVDDNFCVQHIYGFMRSLKNEIHTRS